jgi:hypothetical protein
MNRVLPAVLIIAVIAACAPANQGKRHDVVVYGGGVVVAEFCPAKDPASSPRSQFRVFPGSTDPALEKPNGTLIFKARLDASQAPSAVQVSLRDQTIRRDLSYGDSVVRVTVPAGRYYFRARRIGAQTLQDSIDVRSGFADTVRIVLVSEMLCSPSTPSSE